MAKHQGPMSKTARVSMRNRQGTEVKYEPDPTINRLIPLASGTGCYYVSLTDGKVKKYKLNSPEFRELLDGLAPVWRKKLREEVVNLIKRYPESDWPHVYLWLKGAA